MRSAALAAVLLAAGCSPSETTTMPQMKAPIVAARAGVPAIDLQAPAIVETATFAVG